VVRVAELAVVPEREPVALGPEPVAAEILRPLRQAKVQRAARDGQSRRHDERHKIEGQTSVT